MDKDIIKQGASYLLRGGTLLSEPCKYCGNLQIKYKNEIFCINCSQSTEPQNLGKKIIRDSQVNNEVDQNKKENVIDTNRTLVSDQADYNKLIDEMEKGIINYLTYLYREFNNTDNFKDREKYLRGMYNCLRVIEKINRIKI